MGISTPDSENDQNYYNRFMDFEHPSRPGEQMFKVIKLALACDDCVDAGKASECTHRSHLLPPWKSSGTMRRVAVLMDNAKLHQQENMGMLQPSTKYLFPPHLIKKMQKLERQDWEGHKPQIVYIGIDPSGGGNSNYAMASTARDSDGRVWIVGLDHTDSIDYRVIDGMIFRHIYALRKHPLYKDCLFVVFVEANMSALDTGRVHDLIKAPELEPIDVISMDPKDKGRIGIWTTPTNKECYINLTVELMEHRALGFCKETVTVTSTADSKDIEKDLIGQMRMFRKCEKVSAMPEFVDRVVKFSGKTATMKDDLLMALMFTVYFPVRVARNHDIKRRWSRLGFTADGLHRPGIPIYRDAAQRHAQ